jgi:hypothetical protein
MATNQKTGDLFRQLMASGFRQSAIGLVCDLFDLANDGQC